jgi:hypothetical protein
MKVIPVFSTTFSVVPTGGAKFRAKLMLLPVAVKLFDVTGTSAAVL